MINTFECLSDDLLAEIFSYLSLNDLYRIFSFLNERLKKILRSFKSFELILNENDRFSSIDLDEYFPRLHSLILFGQIDIRLSLFPHLHRLVLRSPSKEFFHQFDDQLELFSLEFLSITNIFFDLSSIYERIFSNRYPRLRICRFDGFETIETIRPWKQTPSIEYLQMGSIDFHVFKSLISSCPSIRTLKFEIFQSYLKFSSLTIHRQLTKLTLKSEITDWIYNDQWLERCLSAVPNLKQLNLQRCLPTSLVTDLIPDYHWCRTLIDSHLLHLESFVFHFHIEFDRCQTISNETRRRLRNDFVQIHRNSTYRTRIRFRF